jgi:hypothetical protein
MRFILSGLTASLLLACRSEQPTNSDLALTFQQTPAHALICRIHESGKPVPKICTQIMCPALQPAEALLSANPDLGGERSTLRDLPLGDIMVGGNPSVCARCENVGGTIDPPVVNCSGGIRFPPLCTSGAAACADLAAGHKDHDQFASPATIDGFVLSTTEPATYNQTGGVLGVQFRSSGLEIKLPSQSCIVTLGVGTWASPVTLEALDKSGKVVDSAVTPPTKLHHMVLHAAGIDRVKLSGGSNEGALFQVCATQ